MLTTIAAKPTGKDAAMIKDVTRAEGEEVLVYDALGVVKARLTGRGRTFCPASMTMVKGTPAEVEAEVAAKALTHAAMRGLPLAK